MDNSIPALERALLVMTSVEQSANGATAHELGSLGIPRTTLYRILRLLVTFGYLKEVEARGESSRFELGQAILRMARGMSVEDDLVARAQPVIARLSNEIGETIKVVVRDGVETVAVAVGHPGVDSRVAARIGARLPLHVGAGQRLLLSRAPSEIIEQVLNGPLENRNVDTIVDPEALRRNLARLRKLEWTTGGLEGAPGVGSIGALVREPGRPIRAAIVAVYVMSGRKREEVSRMADAVARAARVLSGQ